MQHLPDDQCRRCGHSHDETAQLVDPENRWAITTARCTCGHRWSLIYTAPANLASVRSWLARGCPAARPPVAVASTHPWHRYRLEGVDTNAESIAL